jgi:hypothetical protein
MLAVFVFMSGGCGGGGDSSGPSIDDPNEPGDDIGITQPTPPAFPDPPETNGQWENFAVTSWYYLNPNAMSFTISTAGELAGLARLVNSRTADFNGKTIRLSSNVNLAGKKWKPIATFRGTFDGEGHTIANMTVVETIHADFVGLFGRNENGTLKNIHLTDVYVHASGLYYETPSNDNVGGLVGNNSGGTITSCTISGNVFSSTVAARVGGLVGVNSGKITNCTASSNAYSRTLAPTAGGLVGYQTINGEITNCAASGNVSSTAISTMQHINDTPYYSSSIAGGLVGQSFFGEITNCTASSNVSSYSSDGDPSDAIVNLSYAGGLVGHQMGGTTTWTGTITGCTASGSEITAVKTGTGEACSGGFIGYLYSIGTLNGNHNNSGISSPAIGWDRRVGAPSNNI